MSHELFYTSAPKGLRPGSRGFCTVASTEGLPAHLAEQIESLSAYRPIFPPLDARAKLNPIVYSHLRITGGSKTYHVLSRIGPAGLDYSQRSNKFAHHVILEPGELPAGGPAWLLAQPGFLEDQWDGEVRYLAAGRIPPKGDTAPSVCRHWRDLTGDAGWAGVLADAFEKDPLRPIYLIFSPGTDVLPLVVESLMLLPPPKRWLVTFSTYFTNLPQGIPCLWRFVAKGSPEAANASRLPGALVINLCDPLGKPVDSDLVEQARTGRIPAKSAVRLQEIGGPSNWANEFEHANQGYSLLEKGERLPTNAKAPPPLNALRRPVAQLAKPKRTWIWAALIGLIIGLMSGILASFLTLNSKEHLANRDVARLENEIQVAVLEDRNNKQGIAKLEREKHAALLEKEKVVKQRDTELLAKEKLNIDLKRRSEELGDLELNYKIIQEDLNKARRSLEKNHAPPTASGHFPLPEWVSKAKANEGKRPEIDIAKWGIDKKGKFKLALLGPGRALKSIPGENSLIIELELTKDDKDDVAKFAVDGGKLSFEWLTKIPEVAKKHLAVLRESVLEIKNAGKTCWVAFRAPINEELSFSVSENSTLDFVRIGNQDRPSQPLHFQSIEFNIEGRKYSQKDVSTYPCLEFIPIELENAPTKGTLAGIVIKNSRQKDKLVSFECESTVPVTLKIEVLSLIGYLEVDGIYVEVIRVGSHQ